MIKINLVREGRAVRGAGAAPAAASAVTAGATSINNILLISFVILGVLGAAGYWLWEKRELANRQAIVTQRKSDADKLEGIIKEVENYQKRKDNLQKRIDLINQLKQNQKGPVRIMDQISRDLPDLVWLDHMSINAGSINISGRGLNPNAIANFVENVKKDPFFEEPALNDVTQVGVNPLVYSFNMTFGFTYYAKGSEATTGTTTTTGTTGTAGTAATTSTK